jgi:hypothetical protein
MDNPEKLATQDEEKQHVFDTTFTRSSNAIVVGFVLLDL